MENREPNFQPIRAIKEINHLYKLGKISKEEAEVRCQEPLAEYNKRASIIAKEFGKRPRKLTFGEAMRIRNFYV